MELHLEMLLFISIIILFIIGMTMTVVCYYLAKKNIKLTGDMEKQQKIIQEKRASIERQDKHVQSIQIDIRKLKNDLQLKERQVHDLVKQVTK